MEGKRARQLASFAALTLTLTACPQSSAGPGQITPPGAEAKALPAAIQPEASQHLPAFDEAQAWKHMTAQVGLGPRVPGSKGHRACRRYIEKILTNTCERVEQQEFSVRVKGKSIEMANIIGRFGLEKPRRIMLAAHWDTRPTADMNPPGLRNQPIEGANDGASGVAILLELARVFKSAPPPVGVDLVFFDGEDYGPGLDMMFLGAKHMAKGIAQSQINSYNYAILLDMVGDAALDIHPETNSEAVASQVYARAIEVSEALGYRCFLNSGAYEIYDDHLPLIQRGLRMYDFIDFNYKPWHTTEDTLDKCSPKSLRAVGQTVEVLVYDHSGLYGPDAE